jgi:integrase
LPATLKLTQRKIESETCKKLTDGGGLFLDKREYDKGYWKFAYSYNSERFEMSIGVWPYISLNDARKTHTVYKGILAQGKNPKLVISENKKKNNSDTITLEELFDEAFDNIKGELKNNGDAGKWRSPVERHVLPELGQVPIKELTQRIIVNHIKQIWVEKNPTGEKIVDRLNRIFKYAQAAEYDFDYNLMQKTKNLLPKVVHTPQHLAAMRWQDVPAFYQELCRNDNKNTKIPKSWLSCRLSILTAVRSNGVRGARFNEFIKDDEFGTIWTVPKERVKGKLGKVKDFTTPLSAEAERVIKIADNQREEGTDLLFPGDPKRGFYNYAPITSTAVSGLVKSKACTVHGFRTSFKTFCQDIGSAAEDISEMFLDHRVGNSVRRAYARSELLEALFDVAEEWASFVTGRKIPVLDTFSRVNSIGVRTEIKRWVLKDIER